MEDILQRLKYEDLNQEQQDFADLVGLDVFKALVRKCGGTYLYIPKEDNITRPTRNAMIKAEFTGSNFRELAKKYQLSEVQIRSIVAPKNKS